MKLELRMQNLNSNGNFPITGKRGSQDVVSRSVPDTVLKVMGMAGHVTLVYCLQVYLEEKRKLNRYEWYLRFSFENEKHLSLVGSDFLLELPFSFLDSPFLFFSFFFSLTESL